MEFQTAAQPSTGSSSAAFPRWVLLERTCEQKAAGTSLPTADAITLAAARTSAGLPIQVSLRLAAPPAASRVCLHCELPDGVDKEYSAVVASQYSAIVAAHGDSVLLQVCIQLESAYVSYVTESYVTEPYMTIDDFVYSAGDAAADPPRPPSLALLPPYYLAEDEKSRFPSPVCRSLITSAAGLVRRGEGELVVAELTMMGVSVDTPEIMAAELFMFRSGEWSVVKRPPIRSADGEHEEINFGRQYPFMWRSNTVITVGDRILCWVDLSLGVLFCDVFEESPRLQYLPLPIAPCFKPESNRNVCVTGGTLKFVNIFPRCCCGEEGPSWCSHSSNAYIINTWTLSMDDMVWVKDGMVDATELWGLDTYNGLPRFPLDRPVVSVDEPSVVCFMLCQVHHNKHGDDHTLWLLKVDMRTKIIQSVSLHGEPLATPMDTLVPSNVSGYFNSYRDATSTGQRQVDIDRHYVVMLDKQQTYEDASNSMLQSCCKSSDEEPASVQALKIFEALEGIPNYGLDDSDMLKAYRILSHDKGRRFRSLLKIPVNSRKEWLLMEIKGSKA